MDFKKLVKLDMAHLSYAKSVAMDLTDNKELRVIEARDNFSRLVNRAAFGGEVTFIHRSRNHETVAAIVPADLIEHYEALLDQKDGRIALEHLANLKAGKPKAIIARNLLMAPILSERNTNSFIFKNSCVDSIVDAGGLNWSIG